MRILVVDDEVFSRMKLQKMMEDFGECDAVESGEAALDIALSNTPPDLILLDIMMPGMDGYAVCENLKSHPETTEIPVIFLSGNTGAEDITRGLELGAVDYITKPFQKAEVKARVQTHLSLKRALEDLHCRNITLQEQIEEIREKTEQLRQKDLQLIEMDRIAGIGTLAAGIAHEVNNPLGIVKSAAGAIRKSLDKVVGAVKYWDGRPLPASLQKGYTDYLAEMDIEKVTEAVDARYERIERGIERIIKIVNSLRSFSRVDKAAVGEMDINQSIEDAVEILGMEANGEVALVKVFQDVPPVECAATEINQCFLHIIKNALDAVDQKGEITLSTEHNQEAGVVSIRVTDSGRGMSPEILRQAPNPFFTTKPVGSGTGVGLSLTERIVKRHGGKLDIQSKEDEGTRVTISLPSTNVAS